MGQHTLWTLRESRTLTAELFQQFKETAARSGYGPTGALIRLIRRYLTHGFDDGQPEQADRSETPPVE
jgi:hypothetical protein